MTKKSHWERICSSDVLPVQVDHCVVFEQIYDPEAPCAVMHPSPQFIAELMYGGIHPPISALLDQKLMITSKSGQEEIVSRVDVREWRAKNGPIAREVVIDNSRANAEVEGPLTYEQAVEYCVMKDIPVEVWGRQHNRRMFAIVGKSELPDRSTRDAWRMAE